MINFLKNTYFVIIHIQFTVNGAHLYKKKIKSSNTSPLITCSKDGCLSLSVRLEDYTRSHRILKCSRESPNKARICGYRNSNTGEEFLKKNLIALCDTARSIIIIIVVYFRRKKQKINKSRNKFVNSHRTRHSSHIHTIY